MKRFIFVLFGLSVLLHSPAYAGGLVGEGKITVLQQGFAGWVLKIEGMTNVDRCAVPIIYLAKDVQQYETQFSLLLTAFATGKPVDVRVTGCTAGGYMVADWVRAVN